MKFLKILDIFFRTVSFICSQSSVYSGTISLLNRAHPEEPSALWNEKVNSEQG